MQLLKVNDLSVSLDGNTLIEDIDFTLEEGEDLAILGPNGAGKTILLKALLGMIPYEGRIEWAPKTTLGYVPQKIEADRQVPLTVRNLLNSKAKILGASQKEINEVIHKVDLTPIILQTQIGHLSGGQFQRALIAFALLGKPNVILFDEPTASIDERGEEQVYELIHRLQDEIGITAIVVSHDLTFVYRYATQVLCINKQDICFGPPHEILTPKNLEKVYGHKKYYHHIHEHHHDSN